jgi:hypothetical protein
MKSLGINGLFLKTDSDDNILCGYRECKCAATHIFHIPDGTIIKHEPENVAFRCSDHDIRQPVRGPGWKEIEYNDWIVLLVHRS